jgi:hypothetical protein
MAQSLSLFGFRALLLLVYLVVTLGVLMRRRQLGEAALPGALGFGVLATGSLVSSSALYWQVNAVSHHESIRNIALMLGILTYVAQALAIIGTMLVAAAVFLGRPKGIGDIR